MRASDCPLSRRERPRDVVPGVRASPFRLPPSAFPPFFLPLPRPIGVPWFRGRQSSETGNVSPIPRVPRFLAIRPPGPRSGRCDRGTQARCVWRRRWGRPKRLANSRLDTSGGVANMPNPACFSRLSPGANERHRRLLQGVTWLRARPGSGLHKSLAACNSRPVPGIE